MEKVKAVVIRAKQLPLNKADLLMFPFAFSVLMDFMMQAVELFYDFRDECAAFINGANCCTEMTNKGKDHCRLIPGFFP